MTPIEWGKLQGFIGYGFVDKNGNDRFAFPSDTPETQMYKQFGNSVSIPVIQTMAEYMLECFKKLETQQFEVVKTMADNLPFITKKDVMDMLNISSSQATSILKKMISNGEIVRISKGKTTRFTIASKIENLPPYSNEEKVIELATIKNSITNADVMQSLNVSRDYASVLLSKLVKKGYLVRISRGEYSRSI